MTIQQQWEDRRRASCPLSLPIGRQRVASLARRYCRFHHSDHAHQLEGHTQGCTQWRDEYPPARLAQVAQGIGQSPFQRQEEPLKDGPASNSSRVGISYNVSSM